MNFAHCLNIALVIGKYPDVFRRVSGGGSEGGGYVGVSFHEGIFRGGIIFLERSAGSPRII